MKIKKYDCFFYIYFYCYNYLLLYIIPAINRTELTKKKAPVFEVYTHSTKRSPIIIQVFIIRLENNHVNGRKSIH
uniref:Secreted protein n=1 Tax=Schistosoma mansoni TaxID=6183 RepID=A0A5K4F6H6_SCHMA